MIDRRSLVLLAFGGLALLGGLAGALVLLGIGLPGSLHLAGSHGLLMTFGFLGTMIALERAVALGRRWAYLAPAASGVAALSLLLGMDRGLAAGLIGMAGIVFAAMYVAFDRIADALHTRTQAVGALAWMIAAVLLLAGRPVVEVVPWLAALLVLVIAGERLELSRLGQLAPRAKGTFIGAMTLFSAGIGLTLVAADVGLRLAGIGLLALAAWLAMHDMARRTVHFSGVTRFIAWCLLIGYAWLAVAGAAWLAFGSVASGPAYDAMLHAIFLGFVISMVFGHAPVIVPAVLRAPLPYHPRFYAHLGLLHAGLLLRIVGGDGLGVEAAWRTGGVLNVVALLLFVGSSAAATVTELRRRAAARRRHAPPVDAGADVGSPRPAREAGAPREARDPAS